MEPTAILLPPLRTLVAHVSGIRVHPDPYHGPFEAYHHRASSAQTWDLAAISETAADNPGPVLDVGAGRGRLTLALARDGHRVTAVDTSERSLVHLRDQLPTDARVVHGDVTEPGLLPTAAYRTAALGDLSINMFATGDAVERLLRALHRVLTDDGVLCFPVLQAAALPHMARLNGVTVAPFTDHTGRQRLLWLVLRHVPDDGPAMYRNYFCQDDTAPDGTVTGDLTAVRERLWTAETIAPHLAATGFTTTDIRPLGIPAPGGGELPAALLVARKATE